MQRNAQKSAAKAVIAAVCASSALLLTARAGWAQSVTISDGTFNDSDWTETVVTNTSPADWTYSVQQYTTGGNPDDFRGQTWTFNGNDSGSTLGTFDAYAAQPYNPATQGSIQYLNYNIDDYIADVMGGTNSRVIFLVPALEQNGTVYDAGAIVTSSPTWETNGGLAGIWSDYDASVFNVISGSGAAHPNFSATGAPITFGYYDQLSDSNSSYQLFHAVDNFAVQAVHKVQPTTGSYVVNVDLGSTDPSYAYSGQGGIPSSGDNWNIVNGAFNPVSQLKDSENNATTVGYRWNVGNDLQLLGPLNIVNDVFDSSRNSLMADGSFNGIAGNTTPDAYGGEMYITGLVPNGTYNLALYGVGYGASPSTTYLTKFTVNGTSQTTAGPIDDDDLGGNYIVDNSVIADANGEIRVQVHNANYLDPNTGQVEGGLWVVNGFQVQNLGVSNPTWNGGNGNWSSATSWTNGTPSGAGAIAEFDSASSPTTVNVDSPETVGVLAFNSTASYTITGSAITLDGNGYDSMINVTQGKHEIAAPITAINGETEIVISDASAGQFTGLISRLSLGTGSTLDLTSNSLIVQYFGANPFSTIQADVTAAYDNGKWDQPGITTSLATDPTNQGAVTIGVVDNSVAGWGTFRGEVITSSTVLVVPTWYGDTNLDGVVDNSDLTALNYGAQNNLTGWQNGDFNYDGKINADDYSLYMLGAADQQGPIGSVPEPTSLAAVILGACLCARQRKRI
ncbi:MAG TPA: dockerin type I repeat-containing protein [Tepidisphaeraceae bacterium]|jgi:hypothetical protein